MTKFSETFRASYIHAQSCKAQKCKGKYYYVEMHFIVQLIVCA